ncbi:MAG: tRNA (guanine(46)-N(7))-methyltransferase TrmB [Alphaproteobacteria bacterium]
MSDETKRQTGDKFYGRRKGKALSPSMQDRFDEILPKISIEAGDTKLNKDVLFKDKDELWLEVGFGGGEHLSATAQMYKQHGLIGCEPYINGTAKLLRDIDELNLDNVLVYPDDARHIMDRLEDNSVDKAFALFGDPWRKYRHRYRRFISPDNLDRLARILKPGAILRIATDHPKYLQWIMKWAPVHPDFEWLDNNPNDWGIRDEDWFETRYERKAIREGRKPYYFTFKRN